MSNKGVSPVHNFPNGLYDLLIDQTALDAVQYLVSAGFAQIESLTGSERRRRLSAELARYLADLLDDLSVESDVESEQTELALINSLLVTLRHAQLALLRSSRTYCIISQFLADRVSFNV